ncbi:unnamed protein product [Victoria cruziana]
MASTFCTSEGCRWTNFRSWCLESEKEENGTLLQHHIHLKMFNLKQVQGCLEIHHHPTLLVRILSVNGCSSSS